MLIKNKSKKHSELFKINIIIIIIIIIIIFIIIIIIIIIIRSALTTAFILQDNLDHKSNPLKENWR